MVVVGRYEAVRVEAQLPNLSFKTFPESVRDVFPPAQSPSEYFDALCCSDGEPQGAQYWLWTVGNVWVASAAFRTEGWWSGVDADQDLGEYGVDGLLVKRRDLSTYDWCRHIHDIPGFGTLSWADASGASYSLNAQDFIRRSQL